MIFCVLDDWRISMGLNTFIQMMTSVSSFFYRYILCWFVFYSPKKITFGIYNNEKNNPFHLEKKQEYDFCRCEMYDHDFVNCTIFIFVPKKNRQRYINRNRVDFIVLLLTRISSSLQTSWHKQHERLLFSFHE